MANNSSIASAATNHSDIGSTESTATEAAPIAITSGDFYNSVMAINPGLEVSKSDTTLYVDLRCSESVGKQEIISFLDNAVGVLHLLEMGSTYNGAAFSLTGANGCFEYFDISNFKSMYDFTYTTTGGDLLWSYVIEKQNGSWVTAKNKGSGDFLTGLNKKS